MSRNTITVLIVLISVVIILNVVQLSGLMAYFLPSICWATVAITTLCMCGFEKIRSWTNKRIVFMAVLVAVFQIFIFIDAGLVNRFGRSPILFTPSAIALNLTLVTTTLLGTELSRAYLTKNLNNRKPTLTLLSITLLYSFLSGSILALINFQDPLAYTKFIGENFLPTITENLLATYLALISGPVASLAYRAPMQAFWWFSPILPDLPWGYKSLIGVMTPTIGFIATNMATTQRDLRKAGIPTQRKLTIEKIKSEKSIKGWLAISVFLVLAVWTSTGLFGFYPTIIASESMTPTMEIGDIAVVISTDPNKIQIGDVIQYWQNGEMILHRVVDTYHVAGEKVLVTQGDANNAPDPEPVFPNQVRGKLVFTIPKIGWVSIAIKEFFFNGYVFLTTTLPQTLTNMGAQITTINVYVISSLALIAYSYLLLTYHEKRRRKMNRQILATFTIFMFALAITGYVYSHWKDAINMQSVVETANFGIIIRDYNITLTPEMQQENGTLKFIGTITIGETLWTGIIIKNNGTTPTAITLSIKTNDTNTEIYFSNQTHFYGPYTETDDISAVWDKATTMPPSGGATTPPELPAQNMLVVWQNITLSETPLEPFTIKITVTYKAEFQSWTDTVSVIYALTYQGES